MSDEHGDHLLLKTWRDYIRSAYRRVDATRPKSAWLLIAIFVVMLIDTRILNVREDPHRFVIFVSLNLLFFFVACSYAIVEALEIVGRHIQERERLYSDTLGDREFAAELGRRVAERRRQE